MLCNNWDSAVSSNDLPRFEISKATKICHNNLPDSVVNVARNECEPEDLEHSK